VPRQRPRGGETERRGGNAEQTARDCLRFDSNWTKLRLGKELSMQITNIHEAETHLSQLIRRAVAGEKIVIGHAGDPLVELVPFQPMVNERRGGQWHGRVWVAEDFDELPSELASAFLGERP
jgi:antitoxin (DNA-binding transcriptional repressor) of toxin-antitoxin stability system